MVSPELADVLSAIICRVRDARGNVPSVSSYYPIERVWNPPMPLLFQRKFGTENRALPRSVVRNALNAALAATGLTGVNQEPLHFTPHEFRRLLITDAVLSGLPPNVAQVRLSRRGNQRSPGIHSTPPSDNGSCSCLISKRGNSPSEHARTLLEPHVFMNMLVSDVHFYGLTSATTTVGGDPRQSGAPNYRGQTRRMTRGSRGPPNQPDRSQGQDRPDRHRTTTPHQCDRARHAHLQSTRRRS